MLYNISFLKDAGSNIQKVEASRIIDKLESIYSCPVTWNSIRILRPESNFIGFVCSSKETNNWDVQKSKKFIEEHSSDSHYEVKLSGNNVIVENHDEEL
jgi:hypothetical protein